MTPEVLRHPAALDGVRGWVFDIDGTLALADQQLSGYQPLPGAVELLALLRSRGVPYVGFTNGSTKPPRRLAQALSAVGLQLDEQQTLTPVSVAIDVFKRQGHRRLLVLGGEGVWVPLEEAGFDVVRAPQRADDADAVLIGWHPSFGLADVEAACRAVWAGAALYTVSTAPFVASREGRTLGISAALGAAVHSVTGERAVIVGKPSAEAFACAAGRLGVTSGGGAGEIAIVGDDMSLENAMALQAGALSIVVHTGLSSAADVEALPAAQRPHLSLPGVADLLEMLR